MHFFKNRLTESYLGKLLQQPLTDERIKVFGIMAAGRPILMVGPKESEPGETIRKADCGIVLDPSDPGDTTKQVVRWIEELASNRQRARKLGHNGLEAFLAHYEQQICCDQWKDALKGNH